MGALKLALVFPAGRGSPRRSRALGALRLAFVFATRWGSTRRSRGMGALKLAFVFPACRGSTRRSRGMGAPRLAFVFPACRGSTRRSRGMGAPKLALTLAIETSCDETSVAVVEDGRRVLANVIHSQVDLHAEFGGVVPELAARDHLERLPHLLDLALEGAGVRPADVELVAVTRGPGLAGCLLVGVGVAEGLSAAWSRPLTGVNHLWGHIYAAMLTRQDLEPPLLGLVVSGAHSDLVLMTGHGQFEVIGRTRDDAAGEAFDKAARMLGLGYPGGPALDRLATARG